MKPLMILAVPILASSAFAFVSSSLVAKQQMNCPDCGCAGWPKIKTLSRKTL